MTRMCRPSRNEPCVMPFVDDTVPSGLQVVDVDFGEFVRSAALRPGGDPAADVRLAPWVFPEAAAGRTGRRTDLTHRTAA